MEICCPYCGSDQLYVDKKGYSLKKGIAGMVLTGGVGLLAGLFGSNKVIITCLSCGKTFDPESGRISAVEKQVIENYKNNNLISNENPVYTEVEQGFNIDPTDTFDVLLKEYKKDALEAEFEEDFGKASDCWHMCLSEMYMNNLELDTNILKKAIACYRKTNNVIREFFTYQELIENYPGHIEVDNWKEEIKRIEPNLPKPDWAE